jgi:aspartyl-tRNA(Asn)/glutamyl-tRNA(Gln) amidotransferase subunit A
MDVADATALGEAIGRGETTPLQALDRALERIQRLDSRLQAWVEVDAVEARKVAAALSMTGALPLRGIPAGVKDIFDVAGLATRLGAPAAFHYRPERDSAPVARLRAAGAVILGKTHTTEFAYLDPAPTRNPWDPEHTPGGSSSGSAAAVAAGMVPLALGSQTVGSVLRPAAYCGIVGFKPSHGRISIAGVFPLAPSFDHVGVLCRSVRDAALALSVLAGHDDADPRSLEAPVADYVAAVRDAGAPPRLAVSRAFYRGVAGDPVAAHLDHLLDQLRAAGAEVAEVELPLTVDQMRELGQPVMRAETAAVHARRFNQRPDDFRPSIRGLIESGIATSAVDYLASREAVRQLGLALGKLLAPYDALVMPVAPTTAPRGLASTGNGIFCAPASFTGLPAIALPSGLDEAGLPLSVQLVGRLLDEAGLLRAAAWVERVLAFEFTPPLARE